RRPPRQYLRRLGAAGAGRGGALRPGAARPAAAAGSVRRRFHLGLGAAALLSLAPRPANRKGRHRAAFPRFRAVPGAFAAACTYAVVQTNGALRPYQDRKSTRLNSSHVKISYAVF